MPMQEGDQFVDFKAFKAAMQDWAMTGAHKFNFCYKKSDSLRNVVCADDNCPFRISATYSSTRQCGAGGWVELEMGGVGGWVELRRVSLFYSDGVTIFLRFNSILLGAAIMVKESER